MKFDEKFIGWLVGQINNRAIFIGRPGDPHHTFNNLRSFNSVNMIVFIRYRSKRHLPQPFQHSPMIIMLSLT